MAILDLRFSIFGPPVVENYLTGLGLIYFFRLSMGT
jgi:hypothetical protein